MFTNPPEQCDLISANVYTKARHLIFIIEAGVGPVRHINNYNTGHVIQWPGKHVKDLI